MDSTALYNLALVSVDAVSLVLGLSVGLIFWWLVLRQ